MKYFKNNDFIGFKCYYLRRSLCINCMIPLTIFTVIVSLLFLQSCVSFAPPSPMVTFGGPKTTPVRSSDVSLGVGAGTVLFDDSHTAGNGWFGRYKYGLGKKLDVGIDAMSVIYSDKRAFSAKLVSRYLLKEDIRFEGGIGFGDASNGKSLNGDIGLTCGSINENKAWNYYFTVRMGWAKGYPGNVFSGDKSSSDTIAPPNVFIGLFNLGTQATINKNMKFIFEGGFGYLFPDGHKPGPTFYISTGLLFNIEKIAAGNK